MLSQDFQIHNMVNKPMLPLTPIPKKLEKPLSNTVNINFDATISNDKTGFGVIVHAPMVLLLVGAVVLRMSR
ncbi:hypothetical protein Goari_020465 [Gossypium aridum]|uniref:Uncharacterized protein n=1 Tax=Gossypium aridum TaxID=34290 RepID=A0A7J8YS62_GOSAI|nr:hypothetical protein [Gossypium aridum]